MVFVIVFPGILLDHDMGGSAARGAACANISLE
jgi:hypothetical protein